MNGVDEEQVVRDAYAVRTLSRRVLTVSIVAALPSALLTHPFVVFAWIAGLLPLAGLCALAWWIARRVGEPVRYSVACTLLVAALLWWMFYTVAAVLLLCAVLVCVLPARPGRMHVLGPVMVGAILLSALHPFDAWMIPPEHVVVPAFWLLALHLVVLTVLVLKLGRLPTRPRRAA